MDEGLLKRIYEDNERFALSHKEGLEEARKGQYPEITAVLCSDSRVNETSVSRDPFNRVFAIENAGNLVGPVMGSVWYGFEHLKTPLLLIIGHTGCGAIYAAMDARSREDLPPELGELYELVRENESALKEYDRVKKNAYLAEKNVDRQVAAVLSQDWAREGGSVIGMIYEIEPVFLEPGRLRVINVNGETRPERIGEEYAGFPVKRLS